METSTAAAYAWAMGPELTIAQAADSRAQLLSAMPDLVRDARLDMADVTEFDSSGIQLLLALRNSLAAQGQTLYLMRPSAVVRDALATFGLTEQFPIGVTG
ncbi:MAG: STAS domain-containing protein [Rubrivivax sp.]|jgi:anti-sigma B factor antagonist|nr:STAS domain-containing protein [Rubrivivax sp.]